MAQKVKLARGREFQFKPSKAGGEKKYDWDTWLNGELWMLEQSTGEKDENGVVVKVDQKKDYEAPTLFMPSKIKMAARKHYKIVQISRYDADDKKLVDALIVKARDMDEDERAVEDLQRIEDKEKLAQKKAEKRAAQVSGNGQSNQSETEAA